MKIVAISDLHGSLPKNMPDGDVLCICGDICPLEIQDDLYACVAWFGLKFVPWTDSLPYKKVIFIGGNHDFFLEKLHQEINGLSETTWRSPSKVLKRLLPLNEKGKHKLVYLCDNSYEFEGVTFYGSPYVKDLPRWAFNRSSEELTNIYKYLPKKLDVLLTHQPPRNVYTGIVYQQGYYHCDYGSEELTDAILSRNISYSICGHVHTGAHTPEKIGNTTFVNVSIKDEAYDVKFSPFVFEYKK